MEVTNYASKGAAATGISLGATGLGVAALNAMSPGGFLSGLFSGRNCGCSEDHYVNRYELKLEQDNAAKDSKIALLEANIYVDGKLNEFRNYVDGRFSGVEQQICAQNVYNATNTAAISCINGQIAQLMSLTKLVVPNSSVCPGWTTTTTTTG